MVKTNKLPRNIANSKHSSVRAVLFDLAEYLLLVTGFGFLLWIAFDALTIPLANLAAQGAKLLLEFAGRQVLLSPADPFPYLLVSDAGYPALISALCSGALELALLGALILGTPDRSIKQRIMGTLAGWGLLLIFNPARIAISLLALKPGDEATFAFVHDALFRIFLIAFLVGYYALWYYKISPKTIGDVATMED